MKYLAAEVVQKIQNAIAQLEQEGFLPKGFIVTPEVERPTNPDFGDFSCNYAMKCAQQIKKPPLVTAQATAEALAKDQDFFASVTAIKPGFINIKLSPRVLREECRKIRQSGERYGTTDAGRSRRLLLEFVSANPTGPLNIVSARAAAVGDAVANILQSQGVEVSREYYINDAGRQARLLGESMYARLEQQAGRDYPVPAGGYEKDYVQEVAVASANALKNRLAKAVAEQAIDLHKHFGVEAMVERHKISLEKYGVVFDNWFSELSLHAEKKIEAAVADLRARGFVFEQDNAVWFASTRLGDDKDRVLKKADGDWAYLAADIAYHRDKFERGFTELVDLWGPDHHGYIARLRAALQALGHAPESFTVHIVQQVNLMEHGNPISMSKRGEGRLLEMDDLLEDVGRDVTRFFFLMRATSAHLDFDLDLARKHSEDNPVYYVQYAYARICSILKKAQAEGLALPSLEQDAWGDQPEREELALVRELAAYPDMLENCTRALEPHGLTFALRDVATSFHRFYTICRVVDPAEPERSRARLALVDAARIVIQNGLTLLGIQAPESM